METDNVTECPNSFFSVFFVFNPMNPEFGGYVTGCGPIECKENEAKTKTKTLFIFFSRLSANLRQIYQIVFKIY